MAIRLSADFSADILQTRREWHNIFKVMKGENVKARIIYPERVSFRSKRENKIVQSKS